MIDPAYSAAYCLLNRDKILQRMRDRYREKAKNPEYLARMVQKSLEYNRRPAVRVKRAQREKESRAIVADTQEYKQANADRGCRSKYGMSLADRAELLLRQGGMCAICFEDTKFSGPYGACVDHCHETGKIRGILCTPCNIALGNLKDSTKNIRSALLYLEKYESK